MDSPYTKNLQVIKKEIGKTVVSDCDSCYGDGVFIDWPEGEGSPDGVVKCSKCDGTGKLKIENQKCYECDGTGKGQNYGVYDGRIDKETFEKLDGCYPCRRCDGKGITKQSHRYGSETEKTAHWRKEGFFT